MLACESIVINDVIWVGVVWAVEITDELKGGGWWWELAVEFVDSDGCMDWVGCGGSCARVGWRCMLSSVRRMCFVVVMWVRGDTGWISIFLGLVVEVIGVET